jgi:hypothetical protein
MDNSSSSSSRNNGAVGWRHFFILCLCLAVTFLPTTSAMTASPHAFLVQQLNETVALKINGDEFSHWISDLDGTFLEQTNDR